MCLFLRYHKTSQPLKSISEVILAVVLTKTCCFTSLMMQLKEKFTHAVASSLKFGNSPENFTFAFKTQMVQKLYLQDNILQ